MRRLAAAVLVVLAVGCAETLTTSTPIPVAAAPAPTPAASPTPTPSPDPTPEPEILTARIQACGYLVHTNLSDRWQVVTACAYRDDVLMLPAAERDRTRLVAPRSTEWLWPLPLDAWWWPQPSKVVVLGLYGQGRACAATPAGNGGATAYRALVFPPPAPPLCEYVD